MQVATGTSPGLYTAWKTYSIRNVYFTAKLNLMEGGEDVAVFSCLAILYSCPTHVERGICSFRVHPNSMHVRRIVVVALATVTCRKLSRKR